MPLTATDPTSWTDDGVATSVAVLGPLLEAVGRAHLVGDLAFALDSRAEVVVAPRTRAEATAGVEGVHVALPSGSAELRWCPERGVPWAVAAGDDWALPLVVSCGAASLFLDDAMMTLRLAAGSSGGLVRALARRCVLNRLVADSEVSPSAEEVADQVAAMARRRGCTPGELLSDLVDVGFGRRRVHDHAVFELQLEALRAEAVDQVTLHRESAPVEAWWTRLTTRPAADLVEQLRSLPAATVRVQVEAFVGAAGQEGDVVTTRRPRLLLPPELVDAPIGSAVVVETGDGGLFCGGVLTGPGEPARISASTRRRLEQILFDQWVDARPENADLTWHWEV